MAPAEDPANATAVTNFAGSSIPIPHPPPRPIGRRFPFLDGLLLWVVVLFAFLSALFPAYNSDFFLHAATGRLIAHGQYQIGVDPFAFTTQDAVWINHNWLYDWIVFLLYDSSAIGGAVLIVLKSLMIAALAYVMLRTAAEPDRSGWIPAGCVGLAVLALSARVYLQPAVISFLFLGLTLWLLHLPGRLRGRTNRPSPYWLIPPLCLLWVNLDEWFLLGPPRRAGPRARGSRRRKRRPQANAALYCSCCSPASPSASSTRTSTGPSSCRRSSASVRRPRRCVRSRSFAGLFSLLLREPISTLVRV